MNIQIKHKTTNAVLYECNAPDLRAALEQAVREKVSLDGARLAGAWLAGAWLNGARLDRALLVGASLLGARLDGAWLNGASLDGAWLNGARLVGAWLNGASLAGAWLDGASLLGAKLKDATISGDNAIVQIGPIGSRGATLIAFRTDKGLRLQTGCFYGDADTFLARVMETHGTNRHATNYRNALKLAASMLGCDIIHEEIPLDVAADALERLARVSDSWRKLAQENGDDKRALMDERDTLRAVVRAADAMRGSVPGYTAYDKARDTYDAARAKVTL